MCRLSLTCLSPASRLSVVCRSSVCHLSVVYHSSATCLPLVCLSSVCRLPLICPMSVCRSSGIYQKSLASVCFLTVVSPSLPDLGTDTDRTNPKDAVHKISRKTRRNPKAPNRCQEGSKGDAEDPPTGPKQLPRPPNRLPNIPNMLPKCSEGFPEHDLQLICSPQISCKSLICS